MCITAATSTPFAYWTGNCRPTRATSGPSCTARTSRGGPTCVGGQYVDRRLPDVVYCLCFALQSRRAHRLARKTFTLQHTERNKPCPPPRAIAVHRTSNSTPRLQNPCSKTIRLHHPGTRRRPARRQQSRTRCTLHSSQKPTEIRSPDCASRYLIATKYHAREHIPINKAQRGKLHRALNGLSHQDVAGVV